MCTFCNVGKEVDPPTPFDENDFNRFSNDVWIGAVTPQQLPTGIYLKTAKYLKDGIDLAPVVDEVLTADLLNNIYVFSGAKTYQQTKALTALLAVPEYQSNFYAFKRAAEPIFGIYNQDYLQAEYQTAKASARMASDWKRIEMDADVLPLLQYQTVGDGRVRPTHAALDNIIRPISDPFWKQYYPPNGWRCRCTVIQLSEGQETDLSKFTPPEDVPPLFRMNAGQDGYVFKSKGKDKHPYFDIAKGDKEAAKVNWNLPPLSTPPKPAPIIEVPKVFKPATTFDEAKTIKEAKDKLDELVDQYGGEDAFKKVMEEQIVKRRKNQKAEEKVTTGEASVIESESKSPEGQVQEDKITNQAIGADISSKEQYVPKDDWENSLMKAREYAQQLKIDSFLPGSFDFKGKPLEQLVSEIKKAIDKPSKPTIKEIADASEGRVIIAKMPAEEEA